MATTIQSRRGTTVEHSTFTGAVGEITVDTTKNTVVVHDNLTAGGHPMAKEGGSATTVFNVEAATADDHAVSRVFGDSRYAMIGVTAGKAQQVDQAITTTTRAATTTLGTTLNHTLSNTSTTITAFNGVAGVTYHCRALGAGSITHHDTNLIITQGLASITTVTGDTFDVEMITSTTCRLKNFVRAAYAPIEEGSFTLTGNGWTTGITVTIYYTKIGDVVFLSQRASLTGTSNSTSTFGSGIPTNLRPATARYINGSIRGQDGGNNIFCRAVINADGTIDFVFGAGGTLASWTASGTKIIQPTEFSYIL